MTRRNWRTERLPNVLHMERLIALRDSPNWVADHCARFGKDVTDYPLVTRGELKRNRQPYQCNGTMNGRGSQIVPRADGGMAEVIEFPAPPRRPQPSEVFTRSGSLRRRAK